MKEKYRRLSFHGPKSLGKRKGEEEIVRNWEKEEQKWDMKEIEMRRYVVVQNCWEMTSRFIGENVEKRTHDGEKRH